MLTGDAAVNADAPIICCTAEILANIALRSGARADVGTVVMDEFHFYADPDRGWAWQVPLIELPQAQFLLMSATLGDVTFFRDDLTRRTGRPTALVTSVERPVPLHLPLRADAAARDDHRAAARPTRRRSTSCTSPRRRRVERAQALMSVNVTRARRRRPSPTLIGDFRFTAGFGKTLSRLVRHGIGVHHAGMLPRYRRLVETLAQAGLLKVICGTDTLGVGINVPIRTVLFTGADQVRRRAHARRSRPASSTRSPGGRAGRATTSSAPSSRRPPSTTSRTPGCSRGPATTSRSAAGSCARRRRRGSSTGRTTTFERLQNAQPEPLTSHFVVTHAMVLNVISRPRRRRSRRCGTCWRTTTSRASASGSTSCAPSRSTAGCARPGSSRSCPSPTRRAAGCASSATCSSTSRSTSRCRRSRWPRSSCSTASRPTTRWTCSRSSRRRWTTRGRCSTRSRARPRARPSPR